MDLMYLSIVERLFATGTLLVIMINPSAEGRMNSARRVNLIPFNWLLMELIWNPALFMIVTIY